MFVKNLMGGMLIGVGEFFFDDWYVGNLLYII